MGWIISSLTKKYRNLFDGLLEGVRNPKFGVNNEGSIDCSSKPSAVSMPPQGPFLILNGESVGVARPGLNRALSHVLRPVRPRRSHLANAVPNKQGKG